MTADAQFGKRGGANPRLNRCPEVLDAWLRDLDVLE
jgi:hypothetical protein